MAEETRLVTQEWLQATVPLSCHRVRAGWTPPHRDPLHWPVRCYGALEEEQRAHTNTSPLPQLLCYSRAGLMCRPCPSSALKIALGGSHVYIRARLPSHATSQTRDQSGCVLQLTCLFLLLGFLPWTLTLILRAVFT